VQLRFWRKAEEMPAMFGPGGAAALVGKGAFAKPLAAQERALARPIRPPLVRPCVRRAEAACNPGHAERRDRSQA
jgi:hypothetical protein